MVERVLRGGGIDRLAVMLSGLCVLHCVMTVVALGLVSTAGVWLGSPLIHEVGLVLATVLAALALVGGVMTHGIVWPTMIGAAGLTAMAAALFSPHGGEEAVLTIVGVSLIALAHLLNRRAHG